jgi:hypothetical protein
MNPYPWYADNTTTRKLQPYAVYAARRETFNRVYPQHKVTWEEYQHLCPHKASRKEFSKISIQPEPVYDWLTEDIHELEKSVTDDQGRWEWLSGDPIMRDIAHMLMHDPKQFSNLAKINDAYMNGFTGWTDIDQARVHAMTACLLLGHWDDHIIAKKFLRRKTLALWTHAWIRAEAIGTEIRKYSPSRDDMNEVYCKLPPVSTPKVQQKWPWERVFRSLGLAGMRRASSKPAIKIGTVIEWEMFSEPLPKTYQELEGSLAVYAALDGE